MTKNEIINQLKTHSINITEEKNIQNGVQLIFSNGCKLNLFNSGTVQYQGKNSDETKQLVESTEKTSQTLSGQNNNVFVVYGHDMNARTQLEAMLRRWGLNPLILDQLPSEGQTIIEKLENYTSEVNFAVVLSTPDDEGYRATKVDEKAFRARQNVVLELGMLLSKLGRKKNSYFAKRSRKYGKTI